MQTWSFHVSAVSINAIVFRWYSAGVIVRKKYMYIEIVHALRFVLNRRDVAISSGKIRELYTFSASISKGSIQLIKIPRKSEFVVRRFRV